MATSRSIDPLVGTVQRTLAILEVFTIEDAHLGLSELARRLEVPKTTALRLLRTMAVSGNVAQDEDRRWRLGPATAALGARYQIAFDVRANVEPALRRLSDATGHDVSFFVQDGERRVRLVRVINPSAEHSRRSAIGESMPMDRGAAGKVILAALGRPGAEFDAIRRRGWHLTIGEARSGSASIAAPVYGSRWHVVGALCIGAPVSARVDAELEALVPRLSRAADSLSAALSYGRDVSGRRQQAARAYWHP